MDRNIDNIENAVYSQDYLSLHSNYIHLDRSPNISRKQEISVEEFDDKINILKSYVCSNCDQNLVEPFIVCAECINLLLCIDCFRSGVQLKSHRNSHKYKVHNDLFHLFDSNWSAQEEKGLLDFISKYGYGNWEDISRHIRTKTLEECKQHYEEYYIQGTCHPDLPVIKPSSVTSFFIPNVPFLFKMNNCNDPPRYLPDSSNFQMTAGYRAARNDFDMPFDPSAESIISNININQFLDNDECVDVEFASELHCALLRAYNSRLRERCRRYVIMRRYGLIMPRYTVGCLNELNNALSLSGASLAPFIQLMTATEFDLLLEGLLREKELKNNLYLLMECREQGIKSLTGSNIYKELKALREKHVTHQSKVEAAIVKKICNDNKSNKNEEHLEINNFNLSSRRKSVPLPILGLPGYERLSREERILCAEQRITPNNFLTFRDLLVTENQKMGSLKLAEARRLIKIDVNKTRKIYDYCLKEGFISNGKS